MFDGQFKSKPVVALRGSSHAGLPAGHVIEENRKRRETRQAQRQEEDAALTVQRIIRGILTRSRVRQESRGRFEHALGQGNLSVTTRLLCNFYDARCDHDKLSRLCVLVERLWANFTAPHNLYSRTMFLLKCVEDAYHQLIILSRKSDSLDFIGKIVSDKCFVAPDFLAQTNIDKIAKTYWKLILLVDLLGNSNACLVRLIHVLNTKYHVFILKHLILNEQVRNFKRTVDLIFPAKLPVDQSVGFLSSINLKLMVHKLQINVNVYLDKIVYFILKLISDNVSCNKALDVLFMLLNKYQIPEEAISSSADNDSSDSSEDEMEVDKPPKIVFNFDCLDELFVKCAAFNSSCYSSMGRIAYLLITKFSMSVIQTSPIRWLCLRGDFLRWLWEEVSSKEVSSVFSSSRSPCLSKMADNKSLTNSEYQAIIPPLTVFSSLFYEYLRASHDADILEGSAVLFSLSQLRDISAICRDLSVHMTNLDLIAVQPHKTLNFRSAFTANRHIAIPGSLVEITSKIVLGVQDWVACWGSVSRLTGELHKRDSRLDFFEDKDEWLSRSRIQNINKENVGVFIDPLSVLNLSLNTIKELYLLHGVPFTVPFGERVEIFHHILNEDMAQQGGPPPGMGPPGHPNTGVIKASIRRDYIYEDAFAQLTESVAPNLKNRIQIQLINYTGLDEAGVDGGGLFREFLSSFLMEAFNPNRGFFIETDGLLHPNPAAQSLYPDFTKHYYFIGRLLGKAVYEKLLVDLPLAAYFLEKLLGGDADVNHLRSLDPDMYRNILSLRGYSEDTIADLCLFFIVSDNILGESRTIELKPNGAAIQVTKSNLIEYIHLMADYRLNRQIRVHFRNFAEGFYSVVSRDWLKMFSYSEFQSLISGSTADVDISDLKEHTVYHGVYNAQHPTVTMFWDVVDKMTPEQHRKLLAFVTSNDRTPLLGFGALTPLFAIHSAGVEDRLPTASTCMNLLKLPEFSDINTLEKRLLYVIESGAGFELS